jgi:hypothetical protein
VEGYDDNGIRFLKISGYTLGLVFPGRELPGFFSSFFVSIGDIEQIEPFLMGKFLGLFDFHHHLSI